MRLAAVLLAGLLILAGCTADDTASPGEPGGALTPDSNVDVDTPDLRAQKRAAGIEPCEAGEAPAPYDDLSLPEITLPCLGGGEPVNLNELRGPLVINLFAQWCGPCREELPFYQRLHEEGAGKIDVLGIDWQDPQPDAALALAQDTGVTYPLLADPSGSLRQDFRIRGLPGVVLVDADGRIADIEYVVIRDYSELTDLVEEQLGVRL